MDGLRLHQFDSLPEGLLATAPERLHELLPGPTLIHLDGREPAPLFVSVLLHGNETTGFLAVQALLRHYQAQGLPRSMSLFIGNITAARQGLRRLDYQPDYNRIWPGTESAPSAESAILKQVVDEMAVRAPFASIDIHNNTGFNPHYACTNFIDNRFLHLATLFSRLVVYFVHPKGVQSAALARLCPAVTVECGKPGQTHGVEHAQEFIDACLHLHEIPDHPLPQHDIDLYHTIAQVTLNEDADLEFSRDLDHFNFTELPAGTVIGRLRRPIGTLPVRALGEQGYDLGPEYFMVSGENLVLRRAVMTSMLTLDERIIRQDCLCYLMERLTR